LSDESKEEIVKVLQGLSSSRAAVGGQEGSQQGSQQGGQEGGQEGSDGGMFD
jgi:hypothetical protein